MLSRFSLSRAILMKVSPVTCCQCASPLTLFEAPVTSKLVVCSHCSTLLLVSLTPGQVGTTSRPDPPPARKAQQISPEEEAAELIKRLNQLDRRWSRRWPILGSITLGRAEWAQRFIAIASLVLLAVGGIASLLFRMSPAIPILLAISGIAGCSLTATYRSERRRYEVERGELYVRLIAIYFPED